MERNFDDPKLTAYALGELEESERAAVESFLAHCPPAQQWVEEVRQTAQQLESEFAAEPAPTLSAKRLRHLQAHLPLPTRQTGLGPALKSLFRWFSLAAAVFVMVAIMAAMFLPALSKAKNKAAGAAASAALRQYLLQYEQDAVGVAPNSPAVQPANQFNTESYAGIVDNPFLRVSENPLSTFSIDVDTASYAIARRFLNGGRLPPKDAVRLEEMINYFTYDYPPPSGKEPFSVNAQIAGCPWNPEHRLVRVALKGRELARDQRPPSNLVFLIDVSGSMESANKLPLLKECLKLLVRQLTAQDRVAIVVYAGAAGEVLSPTPGNEQKGIIRALEKLQAGGSTHGSQGIQLAYQRATAGFINGGINRVILCTDGDFNVGVTSPGDLLRLIEEKAQSGVFLSVLGFGMGNYKDSTMEMLADKGNGNYAYIDTLNEGRKVLVEQMNGTLITIAKDVKIQVEFNPARVGAYRLIGYENRLLQKEDFNNDKKDAGEIGAGHAVTALYEIVPTGKAVTAPGVDPLKYQLPGQFSPAAEGSEVLTLKLRYKEPEGDTSKLISTAVTDAGISYDQASTDFKFASAVAAFGMVLRDSPYKGTASLEGVLELASEALGADREGYRAEFVSLVQKAEQISKRNHRRVSP